MGSQLSDPKIGAETPPQFSAHVYCAQTAGWIKIALGTEVGLSSCYIVLDGDPAALRKKGQTPNFWPIFSDMLSPVRLSSVTFVRPTQAAQIFRNISMA